MKWPVITSTTQRRYGNKNRQSWIKIYWKCFIKGRREWKAVLWGVNEMSL